MPRFPTTEAEVIALCQQMIAGLPASSFNSSAVTDVDLKTALDEFNVARNDATASEATTKMKFGVKDNKYEILTDMMKSVLRHSENLADGNDAQLQQIGWGARSAATPLQSPEQPRTLEAPKQGDNWVFLDWKEPIGGGAVAYYKIQRRERPAGNWTDAGSAIKSEISLNDQPKGVELEFRIVSVNNAGESVPSNSVMVVL